MVEDKPLESILRETNSVCPECLEDIPALVIEKKGNIYLTKHCRAHGKFEIEISKHADDYKNLSKSYFYFMPDSIQQNEYYVCATTSCNTDCPICFLKQCHERIDNLTLDEVNSIGLNKNVKRFTFSHGEATLCENLPEIIRLLSGYKKIVNIHTNGIKLADFQYASLLKASGINQISMQFDTFDKLKSFELREENNSRCKLQALGNLKKLEIPVTLNVTVAKGINEDEIGRIFDYAVKESFIKDISFITYCHYDNTHKDNLSRYIMPDELITAIEDYSRKKISRKDMMLFQRLFYVYISVFRIKKCFNYFHYLVVRHKGGYLPISDFINLRKAALMLDALENKKKKATYFSIFRVLLLSLKFKSLSLFPYGIYMLLKKGYPQKSGKFLAITFATICDPYKYDASIAGNCGQGIIIKENVYDSYGIYLMQELQKKKQYI